MKDRTVGIGCDHGGLELGGELRQRLLADGYEVTSKGIETLHEMDYPDITVAMASDVTAGEYDCAILICGTGIDISIAASKVPGIRAALCSDCFSARMAGEHNDANIITLGVRTVGVGLAWEIMKSYLDTSFLEGKHQVRVDKINHLWNMHKYRQKIQ